MFRLSCTLYDNLEILAMRKSRVELIVSNNLGQIVPIEGVIKDLTIVDGFESIVLEDGTTIATKDIVKANDIAFR